MLLHPKYIEMLQAVLSPQDFVSIMDAYNHEPVRGLRFNSLKPCINPFEGTHSELNPDVFIPKQYKQTVTHPLHHAGCYYIQDPSATIPVLAMDLKVSDVVVDLCAAPGGKSSYILDKIPNGFLLSNEIDAKRNQKLVHNMQRWGHEHVAISQEPLDRIATYHANSFDKVLLDAPCSGEGLYRRRPDFAVEYNPSTAYEFAALQRELLDAAYDLVVDGGLIVYATCTLNSIENEGVVNSFLKAYPNAHLEALSIPHGIPGLDNVGVRFIPSAHGEGQYVARIRVEKDTKKKPLVFKDKPDCIEGIQANFRKEGTFLFALKSRGFLKTKLKLTMDGTPFGHIKGKHWDYDHAIAQSVAFHNALPSIELSLDDAYKYLYGHSLPLNLKGIHCVNFANNSLGFVKGTGTHANNRYPKGLRNKFDSYDK